MRKLKHLVREARRPDRPSRLAVEMRAAVIQAYGTATDDQATKGLRVTAMSAHHGLGFVLGLCLAAEALENAPISKRARSALTAQLHREIRKSAGFYGRLSREQPGGHALAAMRHVFERFRSAP